MTSKLTAKQELFCQEYLIDLNATKAAIRAGYSEKAAKQIATENLSKPVLHEYIARLKQERVNKVQVDAAYVLNRLVEIDQMDFLDILNDDHSIKPPSEWPKVWRTYLSAIDMAEIWEGSGDERQMTGMLKKIKWPDKVKNLELLGKHVDVMAFKEKVEVDATVVQSVMPVPTADSVESWEESAKKNQDSILSRD